MRATATLVLALLLVAGPFAAAAQQPPPQGSRQQGMPPAETPHRIPKATSPIKVDGVLDEPAWGSALRLELPYEVSPRENIDAHTRTEAYLSYDDTHFYAAFRAHDPAPQAIRARLTDRDTAFADDFVGIILDTFNDERRGVEFFVNPMGVQMDLVVDDLGVGEDSSWDAIWDSAGRLTEEGYLVEMAIPYTSLRFQRGASEQTWGVDLVRVYPRDRRYLFAMSTRDRNVNCYLCQVSKLVGFEGATPGRNIEITPTVTAQRTDEIDSFPDGKLGSGDPRYEGGVTAKWGITPNLTMAGAVNPDFSQVEADAAQLNVNEQFALFFPEKRPFFLEGADFFETPLSAVYTRTVADPEWGAKLTGKEGRHAIGAFVAQDDRINLVFPGSQGSDGTSLNQEATDGVLRYRRDVGTNSALGGLLTARNGDDYENLVVGVDTLLRPRPTDSIRFQALMSRTSYPDQIAIDFGQPEGSFTDRAIYSSFRHATRNWSASAGYTDIGREFRADLGFMPQVGYRQPIVGGAYYWIGETGDWYSRIEAGGDYDETVDKDGRLIEREFEGFVTVSGPMQSFMLLGTGQRLRGFRRDLFHQQFVNAYAEFRPTADLYLALDGGISQRVDFAFEDPNDLDAARQGDELRVEPSLRYDMGRRVRLNLSHLYRRLKIDEGRLFGANLSQMRLAYQLNLRTFVRAILQYADVKRGLELYPLCADPSSPSCRLVRRERELFTQLLFSYKINPQTVLFLGYSDNQLGREDPQAGLEEASLTRTDRTFFFKVGYAWLL